MEEQSRYKMLRDIFEPIREIEKRLDEKQLGLGQLVQHVWQLFYCPKKQLSIAPMFETFISHIRQSEAYPSWSMYTEYDELLSVITTLTFVEQLLHQVEQHEKFDQFAGQQEKTFSEYMQQVKVNHMMAQTKAESAQIHEATVQMHGVEGNELKNIPLKEKLQMANYLQEQPSVKKIAELTGKFKRIAMKKVKSKLSHTVHRKEVTLGQELSRLIPMELANFILPQSKSLFYKRYVEHETFIFGQKGKDYSGRGPIVICMDESSSMTSLKEESKAFCLALLFIAKKQRRDFAIVPFATNVGETVFFEKGNVTLEQIQQFTTSFLGGGTNYERALTEALRVLTLSEFKKADILFVTDGTSFLSRRFLEKFNETKQLAKFTCTSIVLTNHFNTVDLELVKKFSDKIIEGNDLFSAQEAFQIIS